MIDALAGVARIVISEVVPKGVAGLLWMQLAKRVSPSHRDQIGERAPYLRQKERILKPVFGLIDIDFGRDNVVVAGENDRLRSGDQFLCVFRKALQPSQLVIELRPGRGIAVGQVEASYAHAIDRRLDVTAVQVLRIARQRATTLDRIRAAREDCDTIP